MRYFLRPNRSSSTSGLVALAALGAWFAIAAHAQAPTMARILPGSFPLIDHPSDPGYLGVEVVDVDADKAQALKLKDSHGAVVTLVDHDAPAGQIGLRVNDVLLGLNGQPITGALDLRRMIRDMPPGAKVSIEISRDGNIQTLAAALADRKAMEKEIWGKIGAGGDSGSLPPQGGMGLFGGTGDAPMPGGFHMPFFGSTLKVGAMVEPLTSQMADYLGVKNGLMVKQVEHKSEAENAGLRAFDVILMVGSDSVVTSADWDRALRASAGKPVQITILRDKKQQTLTLQVDSKHRGAVERKSLFGSGEDQGILV
jgi:serine protease Do